MENTGLNRLYLERNPFEPAASGAPLDSPLWLPERWKEAINGLLSKLQSGAGVKALAIQGEYGSGKTYLLRWLEREVLPALHIRPFFFDNPGVQFYDLANSLLRQVGRREFAKMLWEYIQPNLQGPRITLHLWEEGLYAWLEAVKRFKKEQEAMKAMADAILRADITADEEIAYRLAQIVVGTLERPYFEYRDFVVGRKGALVAEKEEAPYFTAIIRILKKAGGIKAVAFLIDEFEEISLQKRLTRKQAYEYLATMKRLINVAQYEDFWLIIAMIPEAVDLTRKLEPGLWERFTSHGEYLFRIPELNKEEARQLLQTRLAHSRSEEAPSPLFPFPENVVEIWRPTTIALPRRLIKVSFYAIAEAQKDASIQLPFTQEFLREIEERVYPIPLYEEETGNESS